MNGLNANHPVADTATRPVADTAAAECPLADTTEHELKPVQIKDKKSAVRKPRQPVPYIYGWQEGLGKRLDAMMDAFIDFPPDIAQGYQDQQFARHLLWILGDARSYFVRLFRHGASPYELDCLWVRLFPYLTGEYPDEISPFDGRLTDFSFAMYRILRDYITGGGDSFDELIARICREVTKVRGKKNQGG